MTTIGQVKTNDWVPLKDFTARPYPMTRVSVKFADGTIKEGLVEQDYSAKPGAKNIMVEFDDSTIQRFTSSDGDNVSMKIGDVIGHYRGGIKRKTRRNKTRRNKKSRKSRKQYKKNRS